MLSYIPIFSGSKKGSMETRIRVYGRVCLIHSLHGPELDFRGLRFQPGCREQRIWDAAYSTLAQPP